MVQRWCPTVGTIFVLATLAAGCGSKPVVGVLLPSTGPAGFYGDSIASGIRLALAEARDRGDLPTGFEVVWADSASDPERAVSEFRALVTERKAKLIIGGATSGEARALLPVIEDLDTVCLSPSATAPDLTKASRLFFRIYPSDELEGNTAGKFLFDRLGSHSVLLYVGNSDYAQGIEPEFRHQFEENLGGKILGRIDLDLPEWQSLSSEQLARDSPGAVYIVGYANKILEVLQHLESTGYDGRILTTSAFYSSDVIQDAGALAEGIIFPLPPFDRTSEKEPVLSFVQRYLDTYQRAPDVFAAHGYDAMRLAIEVMRIVRRPATVEIRRALQFGITEFMGVTGPILFDDYGDVKHYPKMFIVNEGQVVSYQHYMKVERERILREVQDLLVSKS